VNNENRVSRSIKHFSNKGRESLFLLEKEQLYIVEGTFECFYETRNPNNVRFTLTDCFIKKYDTSKTYEELPVIGFAEHINCVRKKQNLEYMNLEKGKRTFWVGKREDYTSKYNPEIDRVSMKLFVDTNVLKEISTIEKRIRTLRSQWAFVTPKEIEARIRRTREMIARLLTVGQDYIYVPWISQSEFLLRLRLAQEVLRKLEFKLSLPPEHQPENALDDVLKDAVSYLETK